MCGSVQSSLRLHTQVPLGTCNSGLHLCLCLLVASSWLCSTCGCHDMQEGEPANIVDEVMLRRKRSRKKDGHGDVDADVMQLISMVSPA